MVQGCICEDWFYENHLGLISIGQILLRACFDSMEESAEIDGADEMMEKIERIWVLLKQFIRTEQIETVLLVTAESQLVEVTKDARSSVVKAAECAEYTVRTPRRLLQQSRQKQKVPSLSRDSVQEHIVSTGASTVLLLESISETKERVPSRTTIVEDTARQTAQHSKSILSNIERWQKGVARNDDIKSKLASPTAGVIADGDSVDCKGGSKEGSNVKWGTTRSFNHRAVRGDAVREKPPYEKEAGTNSIPTYQDIWDTTQEPHPLVGFPQEHTIEMAVTEWTGRSLQAVWANGSSKTRVLKVKISHKEISNFDSTQKTPSANTYGPLGIANSQQTRRPNTTVSTYSGRGPSAAASEVEVLGVLTQNCGHATQGLRGRTASASWGLSVAEINGIAIELEGGVSPLIALARSDVEAITNLSVIAGVANAVAWKEESVVWQQLPNCLCQLSLSIDSCRVDSVF